MALHDTEAKNPDGTPKRQLSQTLKDSLIVMLLTAQRRGEVCTMRWQDVDLQNRWWTIPAESSKNADPDRVPLTPMVLEILERRATAKDVDDRYVFSNHCHTCVAARAKKAPLSSATLAMRESRGSRRTDGSPRRTTARLQTASMAIACAGYRVTAKAGHHRVTIDAITLTVGNSGKRYADYIETCRRKRNVIDYTRTHGYG